MESDDEDADGDDEYGDEDDDGTVRDLFMCLEKG